MVAKTDIFRNNANDTIRVVGVTPRFLYIFIPCVTFGTEIRKGV